VETGREVDGIGGLPGTLGAPGLLDAIGGAGGFGLLPTGGDGAGLPTVLDGLEEGRSAVFFQGVDDPLEAPMPGKTATGLVLTDASTGFVDVVGVGLGLRTAAAVGTVGGTRRPPGSGGGFATFGFGGTSSK